MRRSEDPKELADLREWGKRQYTACKHGTLRAKEDIINTSKPGILWHPFWNATVYVACDTCGKQQSFQWSRNEHGKDTFKA